MDKVITLLACIFIFSCHSGKEDLKDYSLGKSESTATTQAPTPPPNIKIDDNTEAEGEQSTEASSFRKTKKIIKKGRMNFEVDGLEQAKAQIDSVLSTANGYYENEEYRAYGNRKTYLLKLRIPYAKFDSLAYVLENGIGKLLSKNISANDVTEEYVDLNIRLENNLSYLKQYKTILAKAKTIKEILEVQEKIRRIEEEIESKKGQIKYLDDKANFSTLNVEISQFIAGEISKIPGFGLRVVNAFKNGFQGFLNFIVIMVNFWPFLIIASLLIFARKPILNRIRSRKK